MAGIGARVSEVTCGHPLLARGLAFLTVLLLITFAYMGAFRPYQLQLGATADEVLPRFQNFVEGDEVPISGVVSMTFHTIEPNRHVIWLGDDLTSARNFSLQLFTEFADHIAVRKILQGVKQRVERDIEPFWVQNVEFVTFLCTLLIFLASLALLCWRHLMSGSWGAAACASCCEKLNLSIKGTTR